MNATRHSAAIRQSGFTYTEVILACLLFVIVTAVVVPCMTWGMRLGRGGSLQAQYTMAARQSEIRIARYVQAGRAIEVHTNCVVIMITTNTYTSSSITYVDQDNNAATLSNNVLRFDPDISTTGGESTICSWVSPIPGEPMFTNLNLSPMAVAFSYHIGEGTNASYASMFGSSPGFQGMDVRFSATPRNLQSRYD
ncbi:MAG: hypothetical protein V1929_00600 [bacterium]